MAHYCTDCSGDKCRRNMTCMCLYQPSFIWLQLSCQMSCCCRSLYLLQESWKRTGPGSAPTTLYGCAPGSIGRQQSAGANAYIRAGTARQTQMAIWRMATLVLMSFRWALLESNGCTLCKDFAVALVQCSAVQCGAVRCSAVACSGCAGLNELCLTQTSCSIGL